MRPARTAQPLPRYVRRKPLATGRWAYFFEVPTWARKAGCKLQNEALGTDYTAALSRAEQVLLPALDSWRTNGATDIAAPKSAAGTLDWLFSLYRQSRKFTKLDQSTRRTHELGFAMVGDLLMKDGRRFGLGPIRKIDTATVDRVYERLLVVEEQTLDTDGAKVTVRRERMTTVNHAMKSCRRAWNVAFRAKPNEVPALNPFSRMGLEDRSKPTPTATYEELLAFVAACDSHGRSSLGTGALVGWEWLPRGEDIFGTFSVEHYRPKDHPDAVLIVHKKTNEQAWFPLFDEAIAADGRVLARKPLYPMLQPRLDAIKRQRISGVMLVRDCLGRGETSFLPWPTAKGDLTFMRHEVKKIIQAAGLRPELTFTSFRHGGLTEGGDAELTDRELLAQSRHTTTKVLPLYTKKTMRQVQSGARKRLASRTKRGDLSE